MVRAPGQGDGVNPARAGMIPNEFAEAFADLSKPRASGDDPGVASLGLGYLW